MKKICKKLIICLLVFLIIFNFLTTTFGNLTYVYADASSKVESETENFLGGVLNGIAGIITWIPRAMATGIAALIQVLSGVVVDSAGHTEDVDNVFLTPFDVFFDNFTLTNINVFSTDDLEGVSKASTVKSIRESIAMWYYIVRTISAAVLLVMLILIGIKAAISTLASEKARYKMLFKDWLVSALLVLFMHLLIIAIININESIVDMLKGLADTTNIDEMIASLRSACFSVKFLLGWGATISYFLLAVQTFYFVVIYIKRFFVVSFLVVISPIMPLTYVIDKIQGKQGGALNGWFKEFMYNVFIQPLHCLLYLVILSTILSGISGNAISKVSGLSNAILLIVGMAFIPEAEKLLRSLFGFDKATTLSSITSISNAIGISQTDVLRGGVTFSTDVSRAAGTYVWNKTAGKTSFGQNIETKVSNVASSASNTFNHYKNVVLNSGNVREDNPNYDTSSASSNAGNENSGENLDRQDTKTNGDIQESNSEKRTVLPEPSLDTAKVSAAIASINNKVDENNKKSATNGNEQTEDNNNEQSEVYSERQIEEHTEEHTEEQQIQGSTGQQTERTMETASGNKTGETKIPRVLTDEQMRERERIRQEYNKMLDDIRAAVGKQKEIESNLNQLASLLAKNDVEELKSQLENIFNKQGEQKAQEYANSLGNTPAGHFAREYVVYLSNKKELDNITNSDDGDVINLMNFALGRGALDDDEVWKLHDNAINVSNGEEDKSNTVFEQKEIKSTEETDETETSNSETTSSVNETENSTTEENQTISGQLIDVGNGLVLDKDVLEAVFGNSKTSIPTVTTQATIRTSRLLEALHADIAIQGEANFDNVLKFNKRIMERSGRITKTDLSDLYEAVKNEGDSELQAVNRYQKNMTVENASKIKTEAGQAYAQAITMKQQEGTFIVAAKMAQTNKMERETQESFVEVNSINNLPNLQRLPSSENVLRDLNGGNIGNELNNRNNRNNNNNNNKASA